jgi:hypothetical protein
MQLGLFFRPIAAIASCVIVCQCAPAPDDLSSQASALFPAAVTRIPALFPSQPRAEAQFGVATALLGDELFVGASANTATTEPGAVHRFEAGGAGWTEFGKLAPSGEPGARFGTALAVSGDVLVVGAPGASSNAGAAFVYRKTGGSWQQSQRLPVPDAALTSAWFGNSVAVTGDVLAVGLGTNWQDPRGGVVHVYRQSAGSFTWEASLTPKDSSTGDQFGVGLSIDGDRIAVGAPNAFKGPGRAYVFRRDSTGWHEEEELSANAVDDLYGWSLVLTNDSLVVGAPFAPSLAGKTGALHVYGRTAGAWAKVQMLTNLMVQPGNLLAGSLGYGVARDGDLLAATDTGHLLLWRLVNGQWTDVDWFLAAKPGAGVGANISLAGGHLVGGDRLDDTNGYLSGVVHHTTVAKASRPDASPPDVSAGPAPDAAPPPPSADGAPPDLAAADVPALVTPDAGAPAPDMTLAPPDMAPAPPVALDAEPSEVAQPADAAPAPDAASSPDVTFVDAATADPVDALNTKDIDTATGDGGVNDAGGAAAQTSCDCNVGAGQSAQLPALPAALALAGLLGRLLGRLQRRRPRRTSRSRHG